MDLIKREYHIALFETYKELLTEKQKEYFILSYFEDFTLKEVAENLNVSRNAVFDQLKKTIAIQADMIYNPTFDEAAMESEKGPICSEISRPVRTPRPIFWADSLILSIPIRRPKS